jgi:cell division septum initiation protein DivIVA
MKSRAARRTRQQEAVADGHRHSHPPNREQLHRENERLRKENEELRRKVGEDEKQIAEHEKQIAERDKQIADAEKQIADLERQLGGGRRTRPTPPNHLLQTDWLVSRDRAVASARASGNRVASPDIRGITGHWFPPPR